MSSNLAEIMGNAQQNLSAAEAERRSTFIQGVLMDSLVWDLHTHLYPPTFGATLAGRGGEADAEGLCLWGIDELLTYHYLIVEFFRVVPASEISYESFWHLSRREQADLIWKQLFIERSPLSEACRGVLTTLSRLGLDTADRNLDSHRKWFSNQTLTEHIDRVMEIAGVSRITMTNDVFDDNERRRWLENSEIGADPRFDAVLRFDPLVLSWPTSAAKLSDCGYKVTEDLNKQSLGEVRRFLEDWIDKISAIYCAVSLPPDFFYGGIEDNSEGSTLLREAILPTLNDRGLTFAMMIGAQRQVNPLLRAGGDSLGKADIDSLARLCRDFPENRFLCTMLSRENQHELAVTARKFSNLMVFGCWWFLNNPSMVDEITRMRTELLGLSFVPQHSDARVLEQLIYKWDHSRRIIADVLVEKYNDLAATGWEISESDVRRDVEMLTVNVAKDFVTTSSQ